MVSKYTEKNKFGNYTWKIKIDNLFNIFILGTENSSFLVEFKEWKWLNYKTHFTYISNNNLEMIITESFDKVLTFFENKNEYIWTEEQKNEKLNLVLEEFQNLGDILNYTKKGTNIYTKNFNTSSISERTIIESKVDKSSEIEITNQNNTQVDEALEESSFFLMNGNLILAIFSLQRYTDIYGDNLSILIMLARLKILQDNKYEVKKLIIKILPIMQQNIGLIPKAEMEVFDTVMQEFKKM